MEVIVTNGGQSTLTLIESTSFIGTDHHAGFGACDSGGA